MITIKKKIDIDIPYLESQFLVLNELLFFDIETTGFSYRKNMIYLIGCIYIEQGQGYLIQWLAEEDHDEYTLLFHFITLCRNYSQLVHYNGATFDIPFVTKKAKLYNLDFDGNNYTHCDIYKRIRPCKHIFGLKDCKQKTIEHYMGIHRLDPYSGGELIKRYLTYMSSRDKAIRNELLLHNADDLIGLVSITKVLTTIQYYDAIKTDSASYVILDSTLENNILAINLTLTKPVPLDYMYEGDHYSLQFADGNILLRIRLTQGEFKHYFDNHKDYYYIPSEDQAMHKQVAKFIDSSNRVKATRDNCYIKKRGTFIPLIHTNSFMKQHLFYHLRKDNVTYVQYDNSILSNKSLLCQLAHTYLRQL